MFIYKNTKSHSLLFLSVPVRIIPARTWRAVTPGRGAAVRVCVRARCHLFAPEEGTVTSRFDWRQRSLGNRPVVSQSVRFLNQSGERRQRSRSWPSQGSSAHFPGSPWTACEHTLVSCWRTEPGHPGTNRTERGSRREGVLCGNYTRRFNLTNVKLVVVLSFTCHRWHI